MRALWSGTITFGLVNIPARLFSASKERALRFEMLHRKDLSPIRYARICRADGEEIPYPDVVKGYEYRKGDYIVLTENDFRRAAPKASREIAIEEFVEQSEIDPIYFDKPYYLEPETGAEKAYHLLRESLATSGKIGIARFVFRNKEHLAAIKAETDLLILNQLRFADEIRKTRGLPRAAARPPKKELEMALTLIRELTGHFDPAAYRDTYTAKLKQVIEEKAKGIAPRATKAAEKRAPITDLMEALKKSLEQEKRPKAA